MKTGQRCILLITAWLIHLGFIMIGYPYIGAPVLLPSILLCGLATWLLGYKVGLITLILVHPSHVLAFMYHPDSLEGWKIAVEPRGLTGGIAAQIFAVFLIGVIKENHRKSMELNAGLEKSIQERNEELSRISEYIRVQSEAERSMMSYSLCQLVVQQQTELSQQCNKVVIYLQHTGSAHVEAASKLAEIAKHNIEETRNIRETLTSQSTLDNGIKQALKQMCARLQETTGTTFTLRLQGDLETIADETAYNIYRIAHEGVTNALRHGHATDISLTLEQSEQDCILKIINNGNPIPDTPTEGLGMRLIQQRAEIINANIRLETTADKTTRFTCVFPLQPSRFSCDGRMR